MFAAGTGAGALRARQGLLYHRKSYNHPCRAGVMPKITVVGAGNVGATAAQRIAEEGLGEVVMVDVVEGLAEGKALDLAEASPILGKSISLTGGTDNALMKGSDLVVVTAGVARKPGMSRDDLLEINKKIVGGIADDIRRHAPSAVVIVVTNPLDAMAHLTLRRTGFPRERVIGMAGELDTARFRYFIARELNVAGQDVQAILLGGHGDGMVPLPEYTTVNGIPLGQLLSQERIDALVQRTVDGGAEIVKLLKQGSAYYAPSAAIASMARAILRDERKLFCASVLLQGEYGYRDLFLGVPAVLGKGGLRNIIELPLSAAAKGKLKASAASVQENRDKL